MRRPRSFVVVTSVIAGLTACSSDPEEDATPVEFIMTVAAASSAVWVDLVGSSAATGRWISYSPESGPFPSSGASCACDMCDDHGECPVLGVPQPEVRELMAGESIANGWSGLVAGSTRECRGGGESTCFEYAVATDGAYTATFCYGTSVTGAPPHEATLVDDQCTDVGFEMPFVDEAVEFVVDVSE